MDKAKLIQKLRRNMLKMEELLNKIENEGPDEFWLNGTVQLARDLQEDVLIYRFLSSQQVPSSMVPGIPLPQAQATDTPTPAQQEVKAQVPELIQETETAQSSAQSPEPTVQEKRTPEPIQDSQTEETQQKNEPDQGSKEDLPAPSLKNEEAQPKDNQTEAAETSKAEDSPITHASPAEGADIAPGSSLSFNDKAAYQTGGSLADKLKQAKSKDLKKSMPLHEKFRFINELFEGDNGPFNELLDHLNECKDWAAAEALLKQTQQERSWNAENATAQDFFELIYHKFA